MEKLCSQHVVPFTIRTISLNPIHHSWLKHLNSVFPFYIKAIDYFKLIRRIKKIFSKGNENKHVTQWLTIKSSKNQSFLQLYLSFKKAILSRSLQY